MSIQSLEKQSKPRFDFGDVEYKGTVVTLTNLQYRILMHLVAAAPKPLTTRKLHSKVYGEPWEYPDPRIRVHMHNLRERLADSRIGIRIESRKRFGYRACLN